jgi:uncharacterized protein YlxP (DUF503 family)
MAGSGWGHPPLATRYPPPEMIVVVAICELHIEGAESLKEKRMVVKSLRDKLRHRFEIAANEVALQDLHQRARIGIAFIASDNRSADSMLEKISLFVEDHAEARVAGWTSEKLDFDENIGL